MSSSSYLSQELSNAFQSSPPPCDTEARLALLFPNTRAAPVETDDTRANESDWTIPCHFSAHWERVPASLKNLSISMEGFVANCATPTKAHIERMYSASKCFKLLDQRNVGRLLAPHHGPTYYFVDACYSELPSKSLKTLYFFDMVNKILQSQDRSPYVFPTDTIGLIHSKKNKKVITGLYAKNERDSDKGISEGVCYMSSQTGNLDIRRLLNTRCQDETDESRCPIDEILIRHGFHVTEYLNSKGQKCHANHSVVCVTPAANLPLWSFIFDAVLSPPKIGSQQFATQMELCLSLRATFEDIMNNELVTNLGIQQTDFGQWNDYRFNSGGSMGVNTILSPFLIPVKINHLIIKEDPQASAIRIAGMPHLDFMTDDIVTSDYIGYMHRYITAVQRGDERCHAILEQYNQTKDKSSFEDAKLEAVGAYPVEVSVQGEITVYGLPAFPIAARFESRNTTIARNYDTWFANIGGKDALSMIVRALLRSFCSVQDESNDVFPNIAHFLTDDREATAITVDETYFRYEHLELSFFFSV